MYIYKYFIWFVTENSISLKSYTYLIVSLIWIYDYHVIKKRLKNYIILHILKVCYTFFHNIKKLCCSYVMIENLFAYYKVYKTLRKCCINIIKVISICHNCNVISKTVFFFLECKSTWKERLGWEGVKRDGNIKLKIKTLPLSFEC